MCSFDGYASKRCAGEQVIYQKNICHEMHLSSELLAEIFNFPSMYVCMHVCIYILIYMYVGSVVFLVASNSYTYEDETELLQCL